MPIPSKEKVKDGIYIYVPLALALSLVSMAVRMWTSDERPKESGLNQTVALLGQRVGSIEAAFVALDARERVNHDDVLRIMIEIKAGLSRIEGKLEK